MVEGDDLDVDSDREGGGLVGSGDESRVAAVAAAAGGVGEGVKVRGGLVAGLITKVFAIERHELRKFLYMSVMMFAIIYVFTMTRYVRGGVRGSGGREKVGLACGFRTFVSLGCR